MKYFLIAGEASGDIHAAALIEALKKNDTQADFVYLGGDLMRNATGKEPVIHYRDMAYMGFIDVARNLGKINRNFKSARNAIDEFKPDCLILIDYPSFNLKMAKYAKKKGIPVIYYISPKVWAWKEWRVKTIKKVVDKMLVIFPFEVDFYRKHGMEAVYVGNPSREEIDEALGEIPERSEFIKKHNLPDKPLIALLPGSRVGEISKNLPVMIDAARRFPQYRAVIAGAPGIDASLYDQFTRVNEYLTVPVVHDETFALLAHSRAALVTSGTATLEAALARIPQVAMYKGSKMLYHLMKPILKIPFVTLPNLIADRQVIPELLMHLCTPDTATEHLGRILPAGETRAKMLGGYDYIRERLGSTPAAENAAAQIIDLMSRPRVSSSSRR